MNEVTQGVNKPSKQPSNEWRKKQLLPPDLKEIRRQLGWKLIEIQRK